MNCKLLKVIFGLGVVLSSSLAQAVGTTAYGKIVGIETREWGLHIQTSFAFNPTDMECSAGVGNAYMYDFRYDSSRNGSTEGSVEASLILAAYAAQKDISFHIYACHNGGSRPQVGYIRVKS